MEKRIIPISREFGRKRTLRHRGALRRFYLSCKSSYPHKKKNSAHCAEFFKCSYAIKIRTISLGCNFCRFSKGDGLCTFLIVEGY